MCEKHQWKWWELLLNSHLCLVWIFGLGDWRCEVAFTYSLTRCIKTNTVRGNRTGICHLLHCVGVTCLYVCIDTWSWHRFGLSTVVTVTPHLKRWLLSAVTAVFDMNCPPVIDNRKADYYWLIIIWSIINNIIFECKAITFGSATHSSFPSLLICLFLLSLLCPLFSPFIFIFIFPLSLSPVLSFNSPLLVLHLSSRIFLLSFDSSHFQSLLSSFFLSDHLPSSYLLLFVSFSCLHGNPHPFPSPLWLCFLFLLLHTLLFNHLLFTSHLIAPFFLPVPYLSSSSSPSLLLFSCPLFPTLFYPSHLFYLLLPNAFIIVPLHCDSFPFFSPLLFSSGLSLLLFLSLPLSSTLYAFSYLAFPLLCSPPPLTPLLLSLSDTVSPRSCGRSTHKRTSVPVRIFDSHTHRGDRDTKTHKPALAHTVFTLVSVVWLDAVPWRTPQIYRENVLPVLLKQHTHTHLTHRLTDNLATW